MKKLILAALCLSLFVAGCGDSEQVSNCKDLNEALCQNLLGRCKGQIVVQGADSVESCIAQANSNCDGNIRVTSTVDECIADMEALSCEDLDLTFVQQKKAPPASCDPQN